MKVGQEWCSWWATGCGREAILQLFNMMYGTELEWLCLPYVMAFLSVFEKTDKVQKIHEMGCTHLPMHMYALLHINRSIALESWVVASVCVRVSVPFILRLSSPFRAANKYIW